MPVKIAVLGGGPSSLTALYHLTSTPELRRQYDITVYQMGWRCGGKGASGRRRDEYDRIEEHGLHILFGFYQNFFKMISETYDELGREPSAPLATWREAFHPHRYGVLEYEFKDTWKPIELTFPQNRAVPGRGAALNSSGAYLGMAVQGAVEVIFGWRFLYDLQKVFYPTGKRWETAKGVPREGRPDLLVRVGVALLGWSLEIAHDAATCYADRCSLLLKICDKIDALTWPFFKALSSLSRRLSLLVMGLDFFAALIRGIVVDGVLLKGGYSAIDRYDFAEWLMKHGMHEETVPSPPVRTIYDAAFSYVDGLSNEKRIAAGVAVRTLLRMGLTYKGSEYYKMSSGMGDTVFGPLYQVLADRGVKFAFFHKVQRLHVAVDSNTVDRIEVDRQVELKGGDPYAYQPLFDVNGLPCWPSEPDWSQIKHANRYKKFDLESYYSGHEGETVTLERGKHFDQVIYGMPVQTVPFVAQALMDRSADWQRMVDKVMAVETVSFQVWFKKDRKELGWKAPEPLLSLFVEPLNTWADMSQTLWSESWPASGDLHPKQVSYFTGAQPDAFHPLPPFPEDDPDFEKRRYAEAKAYSLEFLENHLTTLLPGAADPNNPKSVDWSLIVDPADKQGPARFDSQYWRGNCGPSERCTLALPDTNQYRIEAKDTGFTNLTVAGDWTDNGFYVACMEGAIMGGIHAARAIAGIDFDIIGEGLDEGLGFTL